MVTSLQGSNSHERVDVKLCGHRREERKDCSAEKAEAVNLFDTKLFGQSASNDLCRDVSVAVIDQN